MGVNRIGEVGDRDSERQAAGVYGIGFTAGSLVRLYSKKGHGGWGLKLVLMKS